MRMTGQQKWAAACGVQMFIIGVFGTPHGTLAQVAPGPDRRRPRCRRVRCRRASLKRSAIRTRCGSRSAVPRSWTSVQPISRVSLTSADVADALVTSPSQLLVHGKVPGAISMFVWNRGGSVKRYEIMVQRDLASLSEQIQDAVPGRGHPGAQQR